MVYYTSPLTKLGNPLPLNLERLPDAYAHMFHPSHFIFENRNIRSRMSPKAAAKAATFVI